MDNRIFPIESFTPFAESHLWQINRDYYHESGVDAWRTGAVPHHMTSNAMVGRTYAGIILGVLKDLARQNKIIDRVYLIELGAGHGRLAYHILKQLDEMIALLSIDLPPYCYVLSDIVEDDLTFFDEHKQFEPYFAQGLLDVSYYDAIDSEVIHLRHAGISIEKGDLKQPILAIANYFFDSLPNDLFVIDKKKISTCSVALESTIDPSTIDTSTLLKNLRLSYEQIAIKDNHYEDPQLGDILRAYGKLSYNTHIFFPRVGIHCIDQLASYSEQGLILISMDKGFHELADLDNRNKPDIIMHGSFSLWVNYHALGAYCDSLGGKSLFPKYSTFHLELACILLVPNPEDFSYTNEAYKCYVNDFGPDDFNTIKKLSYGNISKLKLIDLLSILRLSAYDSTLFRQFLPQIKIVIKMISNEERNRLSQTLHKIWDSYFNIGEPFDIAYAIGGLYYDLGYYPEALKYFDHSDDYFGLRADNYHNRILCYYQLRQDELFSSTLKEAKAHFPGNDQIALLDKLDLSVA